jgi:FHA domain-containing protein/transglycosylase-like protein with SLT domain
MALEGMVTSRAKAWLLARSGPLMGTRFPVSEGATRIGRAPDNDVVIEGAGSATVSLYHAEIRRNDSACRIRDLESTNGTWLNGERVTEAAISPSAVIRFGINGPEFSLVFQDDAASALDRTIEVSPSAVPPAPAPRSPATSDHEDLLSSAVLRARRLRAHSGHGQTITIMRGVVEQALRRSRRRFRVVGYSLLAGLLVVSSLALWKITAMRHEKRDIDSHIQMLEAQLQKANESKDIDRLLLQLGDYQSQAESLQKTLLYRLGAVPEKGDPTTRDLRSLMTELGAEVYSIPPEFVERVQHYIEQDQGPERPIIARALEEDSGRIRTIRSILQQEQLPPDLAYIPLVESALSTEKSSPAGAAGPWQLTEATAKAYGLRVDSQVDERKDLVKSTRAICRYLRDLILDFGAGSSVMLALAAYDGGTTKVKQAVTRTVRDPIKQRNFWYLYRVRALPLETREYVPKVLAAMLIGRNPHHFGF